VTNSYTSLCPDLAHNNPDDAFSAIPYNKGSQFLEYVESIVGEEAFRDFVTQYFKNYQFKSLDTAEFTRFLKQHFGQATYRRF
jgi:leukotriene-A4 hydrolase